MKIIYATLVFSVLFSFNANAQLGGLMNKAKNAAEQKAKEKTEKEKKEAEEKAKMDAEQKAKESAKGGSNSSNSNSNSNSNSGTTSSNNAGTSNSSMGNSSSGTSQSSNTSGGLVMKKVNSRFPDRPVYSNNVGKILMYEMPNYRRAKDNIPQESAIKNEFPANGTYAFYAALPAAAVDYPIYEDGDASKKGDYGFSAHLFMVFKTKDSKRKCVIENDKDESGFDPSNVEAFVRVCEFTGFVAEHRAYPEPVNNDKDLKDSFPSFSNSKWRDFIDSLPIGKNVITAEAWYATAANGKAMKSLQPVALGEFTLIKDNETAILNFNKRALRSIYNRRMKYIKSQLGNNEGMTSETHKNNVGKIVFSKTNIPKGSENPTALTTQFSGADHIHGRMYMNNTIKNVITHENGDTLLPIIGEEYFKYYMMIDNDTMGINIPGDQLDGSGLTIMEQEKGNEKATTHYLQINPSRTEFKETCPLLPYFFNKISPGNHTIKITILGGDSKKVLATGEFNYNKTQGLVLPYGYDQSKEACTQGMVNAAIDAQIKTSYKQSEDPWIKENGLQLISTKICDREWNVVRNDLTGIIIKRLISADVLTKDKYGNFLLLKGVNFIQNYNGGSYGVTYMGSFGTTFVVPGK